ncbi:hypothetical protein [Acinetobacter sp.]|uniref:hypothetical protein n=1 Tax=Acinetobacter sp. TaxID=472 RepID=UPI00388F38DD
MDDKLSKFEKLTIAARYWLLGMAEHDPEYFKVLEALEYGLEHHDGKRNGGEPEFIHQLSIFMRLRTHHKSLKNPGVVYILAFLHDAVEDPNKQTGKMVSLEEVEQKWGKIVAGKLRKLSKEILGQKNPDYSLDEIFDDEDCAAVKSEDRCDNVSTMFGVFNPARLERYVKETEEEFLHRIKQARRRFPHQEAIFENAKLEIINQLKLIKHMMDKDEPEPVAT